MDSGKGCEMKSRRSEARGRKLEVRSHKLNTDGTRIAPVYHPCLSVARSHFRVFRAFRGFHAAKSRASRTPTPAISTWRYAILCHFYPFLSTFYAIPIHFLSSFYLACCLNTCRFPRENGGAAAQKKNPRAKHTSQEGKTEKWLTGKCPRAAGRSLTPVALSPKTENPTASEGPSFRSLALWTCISRARKTGRKPAAT